MADPPARPPARGSWPNDPGLCAIDLEGSGPQDPAGEAILEIALVPIRGDAPDPGTTYSTVINPRRPITRGRWTAPGLTEALLRTSPPLAAVASTIRALIDGRILVGHNVTVDWHLLQAHLPDARPAGLLDTLRLAKHNRPDLRRGHSLTAWAERLNLTEAINARAGSSQPHRALWDALAAAELLRALTRELPEGHARLDTLMNVAGVPLQRRIARRTEARQGTLWDAP